MSHELKVTFQPSGRSVYVLPGTSLLEAAATAGLILEAPCGGAGRCGKCLVRVTSGESEPSADTLRHLSARQIADGYRLACHCRIAAPLVVQVPDSSLFDTGQRILAEDGGGDRELCPAATKRCVVVPLPSREDPRPDRERLLAALPGATGPDLEALRALPDALRGDGGRLTATLAHGRITRVQPGDRSGHCYGFAFDIGTTTLVGTLVDLLTGEDRAVASRINPQTAHGDDVITRIRKCRDESAGLRQLQDAVLEGVCACMAEACATAGVDPDDVAEVVFAGNTTMQEILCGINPRALGELPFVPAFGAPLDLRAADLRLNLNPAAHVHVLAQIGGFVGGDTVAGIVATHLDRGTDPVLLVDVGTNGEIVLAHRGRLTATSVAAGPAFEGARIAHGMRAARGAIEKVVLNGDLEINVIGDAPAAGLCGTGLIDAAAELLRAGLLDMTGRFLEPDELPAGTPAALRERIFERDGQYHVTLAPAAASAGGRPVCLFQRDVRELQLANGAIRAGIAMLLRESGLRPEELHSVLLAGAFGNFIRRRNARRIGMLPPLPTERIRFVGNAASFGAKRVLLSARERAHAAEMASQTRHLDLSLDSEFQAEFGAAMLFPESDSE